MPPFAPAAAVFLANVAASVLIGHVVFGVPGRATPPAKRPAIETVLAALLALAHLFALAATIAPLSQGEAMAEVALRYLRGTQGGGVWLAQAAIVLTLGAGVVAVRGGRRRTLAAWCAVLFLAAAPLAGHAAGSPDPVADWAIEVVHRLAIAAWAGALPSWWMAVRRFADGTGEPSSTALASSLERFSRIATACVGAAVVSGVVLARAGIGSQGDLLGTPYGGLLVAKAVLLGLALACASRLRSRFLPALHGAPSSDARERARIATRLVAGEIVATSLAVGCASLLARTTPGLHDVATWWLPFRWSFAATWPDPILRPTILAAGSVAAIAIASRVLPHAVTLIHALTRGDRRAVDSVGLGAGTPVRVVAAVAILAAGVLGWALAVPAYPDTFRRSTVPYLAVSIDSGRQSFSRYCPACHGAGGLGDGPLAATLPRRPADLSAPHTALHTAGDLFWWIGNGIPRGRMPGFAAQMPESDRWDLINFLRAFSQGFESRVLVAHVVPGQAWLGAPGFYLPDGDGPPELKAYRDRSNVLLAFAGGQGAGARCDRLAGSVDALGAHRTSVVFVPLGEAGMSACRGLRTVSGDTRALWSAYELFTRTVADRGRADRIGMEWTGAEFLIDRFGYIRARWIPEEDPIGWSDPLVVVPEADRLWAEPRLRPPPDDHLH